MRRLAEAALDRYGLGGAGLTFMQYEGNMVFRVDSPQSGPGNLGTRAGVEGRGAFEIRTPLANMSKADIIRLGTELGVDYSLTHSCYDPDGSGLACGKCDSCLLRRAGFEGAGVADPTHYAEGV